MPYELIDLDIDEVSSVSDPANAKTFLVIKRAPGSSLTQKSLTSEGYPLPLTTAQRLERQEMREQWHPLWDAFCSSVYEIVEMPWSPEDAESCADLLRQSVDEFASRAQRILKALDLVTKTTAPLESIAKIGAVMASDRKRRLQDAIAVLQKILDEAMPLCEDMTEKGVSMADKDAVVDGNVAQHQIDTLRKRAETAEADLAKALASGKALSDQVAELEAEAAAQTVALAKAKQTPEEEEAEWQASLPEAVRKRREAEQLEMAALRKSQKDAEERAEKTEYVQKTAAYRAVGMTSNHWNILKAIDAMDEEPRTELLRLLNAAAEQIKTSGLFKSVGLVPTNGSEGQHENAEAQLMSLVKAYQAEHKCDMATAQQAVMTEHQDVYERYVIEKRRMTRVASE